ncbi:DUF6093 family protein [Streptomyces syringium]|uniref:DUF6093 family protein n=1 Tax=Streptomyces syringium TaxID=76729 RepID=UPI003426FE2A
MSALTEALAAGRAAALELMLDTVRIYRVVDGGIDWDTGATSGGTQIPLYTGPARVKPKAVEGTEVSAGERTVTLREYTVSLPWPTPPPVTRPSPGDVIDVTAAADARMAGLRLWVTGVQYSSTATAWRISAEDRS